MPFSIQEKIGVNLGFVGCIESLTAGRMASATMYNLGYPSMASHIIEGLDVGEYNFNVLLLLSGYAGGSDYYAYYTQCSDLSGPL